MTLTGRYRNTGRKTKRGVLMKKAIEILAVLACFAFAGEVLSGGSDMIKFKGYATFRWTMFGEEDYNPGSTMSTYSYIQWCPRLNEYVDGAISATVTTPGDADIRVDCANLNLHFTENFTLTGGQFKVPFGYAYTRSGGSMYFGDRSALVDGNNFDDFGGKDISTMLTAEFAPVTVDLALSNGNGMNASADDQDMNKQFTARVVADPTDWLEIGGSVAMIGHADLDSTEVLDESWNATGMDFFAVANYPVSPTGDLVFVGEYMMLGAQDNYDDAEDGSRMSVMAGYDVDLDGDVFLAIMPALRYDMVTPIDVTGEAVDNGISRIDFCLNIDLFSQYNTLQIGARNYGSENENVDGHTDMYANWRMNF